MNQEELARKLIREGKKFVVVSEDEPFYMQVYRMIRSFEQKIGIWSQGDENKFKEAVNKYEKRSIPEMTSEELRIACAEKMGWKIEADKSDPQYKCLVNPKGFYESIIRHGTIKDFCDNGTMPDYIFDRNALQELIVAVPEERRKGFLDSILVYSENTDSAWWSFLTASPEVIMRAFLAVMED
jgi:hypothetical protein